MAQRSLHLSSSFCAGSVFKPMDTGKRSLAGPRRPLKRASNSFKLSRASAEIVDNGSKPVIKDPEKVNGDNNCDEHNWLFPGSGNDLLWSRLKAYHQRCQEEDIPERNAGGPGSFSKEFARYLDQVWMQFALAHKYYDKAFVRESRNGDLLIEYAEFLWKGLKNVEMAIELLENAVMVHDYAENVGVWGFYASIMWQADDV